MLPDLRKSAPAVLAPDTLQSIVLGGAFLSRGMPSFGDLVTPDELAAIRQYILSRRAALLAGKP